MIQNCSVTGIYKIIGHLCLILIFSLSAQAANDLDAIKLTVIHAQEPPLHHYLPSDDKYLGIFKEIAVELAKRIDVDVLYVSSSRGQIEKNINSGVSNAVFLSKDWVLEPEKLIFSNEIFVHKEYLYSTHPFAAGKSLKNWVQGKSVCTRKDYILPKLDPFLQQKIMTRLDIFDDVSIIKMVSKGRCDMALLDELKEIWLTNNTTYFDDLYRSPIYLSKASIRLALNPVWLPQLSAINAHIQDMQQSGLIQKIIDEQSALKVTHGYLQ